jgi:hypothetical protein
MNPGISESKLDHDAGGKVRTALPPGMIGDAEFYGANREYRLTLTRSWAPMPSLTILWIGMNPSTADAQVNDPTITREVNFSKAWAFEKYIKCNVFDYRATHPKDMLAPGVKPFSDRNFDVIRDAANWANQIVLCYGVAPKKLQDAPLHLVNLLRADGRKLWCLGKTNAGHPRHPLYMKTDATLEQF